MKKLILSLALLPLITSCSEFLQTLPNLVHEIEDQAISINVDRDALRPDTDVLIDVRVLNKDAPALNAK